MPDALTPDIALGYVTSLLQALKPFSYFAWVAAGALLFWLLPVGRRPFAVLPISLAITLLGEGRPWLLPAIAALVFIGVYAAVRARWSTRFVVAGVIGLYAGLHFLFGLITFTDALASLALTPDYVLFTLGLPVAFSFFRLISFAVDAPKLAPGELPGLYDYLTWMFFFPTFAHVPFIKHGPFLSQLAALPARPSDFELGRGARRIAQALLKGILAGLMYAVMYPASVLLDPFAHPTWQVAAAIPWMALIFYVGFSGYADLSVGVGHLFGLTLPESFAPLGKLLRTTRARDFWRNWNLTTAAWLGEYVYAPLGGFRRHPLRNTMLTMILCGLWHSVSVLGLAWGAGLGGMMVVEHWLAKARLRQASPPVWQSGRAFKTLGAALMFGLIALINLAITPFAYTAQNVGGLVNVFVRLVAP